MRASGETLQALADDGAARFGINPFTLRLLSDSPQGDGAVYEGLLDDAPVVLKVMSAHDASGLDSIRAKAEFVHYLAEHGARVARPVLSQRGELVEVVGGDTPCAVLASAKVPGKPGLGSRPLPDGVLRAWGALVGELHALTLECPAGYPSPLGGGDASKPPIATWREEHAGFCHEFGIAERDPEVLEAWRRLEPELSALPTPPEAYGLIHNDLHPDNILYDGATMTLIDFDVTIYFWFAYDLAVGLHGSLLFYPSDAPEPREVFAARFMEHYIEGYLSSYALDKAWLQRLPLFLRYREALIYIVFSGVWGDHPSAGQRDWLRETRARILAGRPAVQLGGL